MHIFDSLKIKLTPVGARNNRDCTYITKRSKRINACSDIFRAKINALHFGTCFTDEDSHRPDGGSALRSQEPQPDGLTAAYPFREVCKDFGPMQINSPVFLSDIRSETTVCNS